MPFWKNHGLSDVENACLLTETLFTFFLIAGLVLAIHAVRSDNVFRTNTAGFKWKTSKAQR